MKEPNFDFEEVFEPSDYLYFYEDVLTEAQTNKEVEFLERELKLNFAMEILDLACGHGRHTNKLAEKGYKVTGVDNNQGFLDLAKQEAEKKGLSVEYHKEDMRILKYQENFDVVLLLFTAFGYFSDEENLTVLKNISSSLKPKGLFCFDFFNRDTFLKNFLPFSVVEKEKNLMIERSTFDSLTGRYINKRIIIRDGVRKDKPFSIRIYNFNEINQMLKETGFSLYKAFGAWNSAEFTSDSKRIHIIAQKN